jgi:anti-sigma regulatory factor (Ser/Thr protein kinase)
MSARRDGTGDVAAPALRPEPARTHEASGAIGPGADVIKPRVFSRRYAGRPDQVRLARAFLGGILDGCPAADDAVLCLSEIAANAVQHSASNAPGGQFTVRVEIGEPGYVQVQVTDAGGPWREAAGDGDGNRGLAIVRAIATGFGIDGDETGRVVSFGCTWGGA